MMTVGAGDVWALWRNDISFTPINRTFKSGDVITSASNAGHEYALAIADLSSLPGIRSAGYFTLFFDVSIPQGSRWQIGIGNKDVRGTNANGSNGASYNTNGLMMQIGDDGGAYYRVKINGAEQYGTNGSSAYNNAYGRTVRVYLEFNRNNGTFTYWLTDVGNGTNYFTGSGIATSVEYLSLIEAYTWANNAQVTLSNVTINYNFFFEKSDETIYIEDLVYNNPLDNAENKSNVNISVDGTYLRRDNNNYYPIKTTGSQPASVTEGDYTTVTATATDANDARFRVRIKTRNELNPGTMYDNTTNTFVVGSDVGMLTDQRVFMQGMTLYLGYQGHTPVVRSVNGDYGLTIIDSNGWTFGNYDQGHEWGTVYKIETSQAKNLSVSGYFASTSSNALQLYDGSGNAISGMNLPNPGDGSLVSATFALGANQWYLLYVPNSVFALKSLSYGDAYFANAYATTTIGSTYTQAVTNVYAPTYSIVDKLGDIAATSVTIDSTTGQVSGIAAGGALKIQATGGGKTAVYYLTVAYAATEYPGHQWNFCTDVDEDGNEVQRVLDTSGNLKTAATNGATATDANGDEWTFKTGGRGRWFRTKAVAGDNAFIVKETNGLVLNTGEGKFFLRNDAGDYTHIGIRDAGASFTIPALAAGDVVELMLRHEHSSSGTTLTATNVKDLRGKDVSEEFLITESARLGNSNTRFVGYYSFIVKADGDVTFALADAGNCELQSIRIYKGPYRSTMRDINLSGNEPAPTTMLLDNAVQSYTFNYCNQLYSTATGPAIYVLKGYRKNNGGTLGVDYDHVGCVSGTNAALSPVSFTDEDAYPVSDEEKQRLYELRKNLVGMEMYNQTWQSKNNSYNNGVIKATSGWGKVTIRMNNYTNDMKYLIGYTNDFTLTIGSAPHQEYPYTWDFTKTAAGSVTGKTDNVLSSIEAEGSNATFSGTAPTNWIKKDDGLYTLNTDNSGDLGSQYVPGAVLVTQDRALSHFKGVDYETKCANDELDGLGFDGAITMHVDHLPSNDVSGWDRTAVADMREPMLSFHITDYATFTETGQTEEGEPVGTWSNPATLKEAGNGWVQIHSNVTIDESSIPHGGIGCRLNDGDTKYIHVMSSSALQPGDIISVTAYNAYNNREAGISFNKSDAKADVAQSRLLSEHLVEETIDYTITTNDGLDGRSDFYLYNNEHTVHITAIEITRSASAVPNLDWSIYTLTNTTITVPDLNADGKQDWIYVSATKKPVEVTNAVEVDDAAIGSVDANTDIYKYKVATAGNALITFPAGTKIYKIGVTHILKTMHTVGNIGWATESRNHSIDHQLTGYFTTNDANAYTVNYDSYDLETATVALTSIEETGYVPANTGIVLRQDNDVDADNYQVPLFYPSYTREAATIPADNMMVAVVNGGQQYWEVNSGKQKFILTNVHWTYTSDSGWGSKITETDAAGFYRLHIWNDPVKDLLPDNCAYLGVPEDELPVALWNNTSPGAPSRKNTIAIRDNTTTTGLDNVLSDDIPVDDESEARRPDIWHTLGGMLLVGKPRQPGVYLLNGQKTVVR